jgi:hypothetical protein
LDDGSTGQAHSDSPHNGQGRPGPAQQFRDYVGFWERPPMNSR